MCHLVCHIYLLLAAAPPFDGSFHGFVKDGLGSFAVVTVWLSRMGVCICMGPGPVPFPKSWLFVTIRIQNRTPCVSQPIRSESSDLMSGCVQYLMQGITTPPQPVSFLLSYNLLQYVGPTIVKPALCLDLDPWAGAHGPLWTGPILSGGSVSPLPSIYKTSSHLCDIRWGSLDGREYTPIPCIGKGVPFPTSIGGGVGSMGELGLRQLIWTIQSHTPPGHGQGCMSPAISL